MNLNIFDHVAYAGKGKAACALDLLLTPAAVACGGRKITLKTGNAAPLVAKPHNVGMRILAAIGALVLSPVMLVGLGLKFLLTYKNQQNTLDNHHKSHAATVAEEEPEDTVEYDLTATQQELKHEMDSVLKYERKLPAEPKPGTWRAFGKNKLGETDESFEEFVSPEWRESDDPENPPVVVIQLIGNLNEVDRHILKLAAAWLAVFHKIEVKVTEETLSLEQLQKTAGYTKEPQSKEGAYGTQYLTEDLLGRLSKLQYDGHYDSYGKSVYVIGFTDHDLYSLSCNNFVYGSAYYGGPGIFSKMRFGDPEEKFDRCLARTIKIFTHEFGHMRHLPHCHNYDCNIGGYMNMKEVDKRPYLFCAKDMAKICYLTNSKLIDQYKKIRALMQNFNHAHGVNLDFAKELQFLDKAIDALSA